LAKLSGMLGSMRGSLGGLAFTKSAAGPNVVMPRTRPRVDPASGAAYAIYTNRALIAYLARQWGELEVGERAAWDKWAAAHPLRDSSGQIFAPSGINMFVGLNHTRIRLDGTAELAPMPPISMTPAIIGGLTLSDGLVSGNIKAEWTTKGTPKEQDWVEISISGPYVSPGRTRSLKWASAKVTAGNDTQEEVEGLSPAMWYWVRVRYVGADGQTTPWIGGQKKAKS